MDPQLVGWLSIGTLFILLALRVPVAFAMAIVGFGGYAAIRGTGPALFMLGTIPFSRILTYSFTVIPLFIIMGHFAHQAGFVTDVFSTARKWLGGVSGGLVQATVAGAAAFGAACGSGAASCAIVGKVTIPEMQRNGVQRGMALGAVAAAGTIATMIPPSNIMVIYGIIADQPVNKMLIAGIIPGIVAAIVYMIQVYIRVRLNPSLAPKSMEVVGWKEKIISLKGVWGIAVVALFIMGGIYTGVFTPTEAGATGAFFTFMLALGMKRLTVRDLHTVLLETIRTVGMLFIILACAAIFGYLLAITRIPTQVSEYIVGLQVNRYWVLLGMIVVYLLLGTFLDAISILILTVPIFIPAAIALGFSPIWYGIFVIHMLEIAAVTPPFGINLFVLKGVIPDSTIGEIIRGVAPYIIADLVTLAIYIAIPQVALWLPSMMD